MLSTTAECRQRLFTSRMVAGPGHRCAAGSSDSRTTIKAAIEDAPLPEVANALTHAISPDAADRVTAFDTTAQLNSTAVH